jgi:hypothetical protein
MTTRGPWDLAPMAGSSGTTVSLEERARRRNRCLEGRVEGTDRLGLPLGGSGDTSEQGAGWSKVEEREQGGHGLEVADSGLDAAVVVREMVVAQ